MWYNFSMSKLSDLESNLNEKQLKVVESDFDLDVVKELYGIKESETAKMIVEALKEENRNVKDYLYTKEQIESVERELYLTAVKEGVDSVKMKAIDSFLDRIKGKPMQKTDVTSGGEKLETQVTLVKYQIPNVEVKDNIKYDGDNNQTNTEATRSMDTPSKLYY